MAYASAAVALVVALAVGFLAVIIDYDPHELTELWCRGGQPDWWPRWLPL